ncbi:MAG TPA: DUF692 family protein [Alphaproteobacteria bacterium]|nr:DUF692 family protein [Alphaproteobacteria bacterium]
MGSADLPPLGAGIVYASALEPLLDRRPELFTVLEFEPQTTWVKLPAHARSDGRQPYRMDRDALARVARLPGRKIVHSIGTPVGGTLRPEPAQLDLLRETVACLDAAWVSDHLSFNRTPEFATGFFLPPRQTLPGVAAAVAAIGDLRAALPVPVAVETGVSYLRPRPEELPDGEFAGRVADGADCGLLLDLHNVYCNAVNGRQPVDAFLDQIPLDRVWEVHLAGGMEFEGFWLDAHSGAVPGPLLALARKTIPRLPNLKAIVFEIFSSFIPVVGLDLIAAEMERLHELWTLRRPGIPVAAPVWPPRAAEVDALTPAAWESALGALVLGRRGAAPGPIAEEPGHRVVESLVHEFSASMIVRVLPLTARLLLLSLGPTPFRVLLNDFWARSTPGLYANVEAEAFAGHLEGLHLPVPHLAEVLAFERAAIATLLDGTARIVPFAVEPLPLLRALADGRLPAEAGRAGRFEIEITPEDVAAQINAR